MADNILLNSGSGGATLAADDISSVWYPIGKVAYGALDSATLVTTSAGFPVQPQTSSTWNTGAEKAEDAVHASAAVGNFILGVRSDTAAQTAGTDGDYCAFICDSSGRLWVTAVQSGTWNVGTVTTVTTVSTVTNVATIGTSVTPGTSAAHLGKAEDAIHATGDTGVFVLAVRSDTAASTAGTDGDYTALITDSTGKLHVNVGNTVAVSQSGTWTVQPGNTANTTAWLVTGTGGTFPVTDSGGSLTVDGTVTATIAAGATTIAKAEDDASANLDVGVPAMAVRKATPANTSGLDGDYEMLQMSAGRLWVDASGVTLTVASHAVTNAGTFAVQVDGSALTALQLIDDPVITDDAAFTPATSKVMMAGFEFDDTTPDSVDEGDAGAARMSARREIYTQIRDAAGNERGVNVNASNQLTVSVDNTVTVASHAVTNAGTFAVQAAQSGTWTVQPGNTANTTAWLVTGTGGTFPVTDSGGSLTVDNGGTFAVQATIASGATSFVHAEDDASANLDAGAGMLAVRKATPANTSGADGDYEFLQMSAGRLWASATIDAALPAGTNNIGDVDVLSIAAGDNNIGNVDIVTMPNVTIGTMANLTESLVDDAAFTPATSRVLPAGFTFDDTTPDSVNEGDIGAGRMSANRCQYVNIRDNAGNERGLNIDASGQLAITIAAAQTLATVTTVSTVTTLTGGGVAHDAGDSGNPLKIGGRAVSQTSGETVVTSGDRTDLLADIDGVIMIRNHCPLGDLLSDATSNTDGASTASTVFTATASVKSYITGISVFNTSASAGYIDFRDGTAGAVLWRMVLPAGGGSNLPTGTQPYFKTSANTALAYDVSAALTTVYINVTGFKSRVS